MITADEPVFPNNIVDLIATRADGKFNPLPGTDPAGDVSILKRPLRNSDPTQCVGVFGTQWLPDADSYEIRQQPSPGPSEPTIQRYTLGIQGFIKDMDEERGLYTHSVMAKMLRSMLYRDDPLRIGLAALSVQMDGSTERTKRWGIGQARYLSSEVSGSWLYLSTLEFWLETEST